MRLTLTDAGKLAIPVTILILTARVCQLSSRVNHLALRVNELDKYIYYNIEGFRVTWGPKK